MGLFIWVSEGFQKILTDAESSYKFNSYTIAALASVNGTLHRDYQQRGTEMECEEKQMEFLTILKQVFDDGQNCAPCPKCDTTARGLLMKAEDKLQLCLDRGKLFCAEHEIGP